MPLAWAYLPSGRAIGRQLSNYVTVVSEAVVVKM